LVGTVGDVDGKRYFVRNFLEDNIKNWHISASVDLLFAVIPSVGFFLTGFREVADAFQVTDDAGQIIYIVAVTIGTFFEITLVDMSAVVADGIRNVKSEIVATFTGSHAQQLSVLFLAEVFLQVAVQGGTSGEVFDVFLTWSRNLSRTLVLGVLHHVEIAVVAVAVYFIAVFFVPLGMFHADIFGGNHFAVEHQFLGAVFLVVLLDEAKHILYKMLVVGVVGDRDFKELGSFHQPIDTDG
jgi:hypothetical protein